MRPPATQPIEVYCTRCRVTFPTGTRRCIHCGGPVSRERTGPGMGSRVELEPEEPIQDEELMLPGRPRFSPLTLLWIALLAGAYLMRMCTG